MRGDPATHRMADNGDSGRLVPLACIDKDRLRLVQRIKPRTVPASKPIMNAPDVNIGTQPASQRTSDERHPDIRELPRPRGPVAADLAARQHQHTPALVRVRPHKYVFGAERPPDGRVLLGESAQRADDLFLGVVRQFLEDQLNAEPFVTSLPGSSPHVGYTLGLAMAIIA